MDREPPITICDLYPDLSEAEREEAETNLRRYLNVLVRMAERLHSEGGSINDLPNLTDPSERTNIQDERSKPSNY
jgi:hypothetical protein